MVVAVTREGLDGAGFRREASRCTDGAAARRMLALAQVMDGASRGEAARLVGMDRQTLRDWVHRYNSEGAAQLFFCKFSPGGLLRRQCGHPFRLR